jgi:methyl-accepting chemotaxis protein
MVQMTDRVDEQVRSALQRLDIISDRTAKLTEQNSENASQMTRALFDVSEKATHAMDTARSALTGLFDTVKEHMEGYKGSIDAYSLSVKDGLTRIFAAFDQETERLATAYAGVCDSTRKTSMDLASQTEEMCRNNVNAMKESSESLIKLSTAIRDIASTGASLKEIDAQLKGIFERVKRTPTA